MSESNRIEYKRELTDTLEREAVAFLNYRDGGVVYVGVDDQGQALGLVHADRLQLEIKDRLKNNIQPSTLGLFDVLLERRLDQEIIKITLASGPEKPYYLKKRGIQAFSQETPELGEKLGEAREKTREKTREKLIRALQENPVLTTEELAVLLSISPKGVEWQLSRLKADGVLRRVGPAKGGHWEVSTDRFDPR